MAAKRTIRLVGWERFQHYTNRSPPWVKLHRDMLTSEAWVLGTDISRLVQCASILLAARYNNAIPYNFDLLQRVACFGFPEKSFVTAVTFLREHEFLEIQEDAECASIVLAGCKQDASKMLELVEESRGEERRVSVGSADVDQVFGHWKTVHNHPKAGLDDKRRKVIRSALKTYSADDLCRCIDGYKQSEFHQGKNKDGKVFDALELMLRDAGHIDAGIAFTSGGPQKWL